MVMNPDNFGQNQQNRPPATANVPPEQSQQANPPPPAPDPNAPPPAPALQGRRWRPAGPPPPPAAPPPGTPPTNQNAQAMAWFQKNLPAWYHPSVGPTTGGGQYRPLQTQSQDQHTYADMQAYIQQNPHSPLARQFARAGYSYGPGGNAHYNANFANNPQAWWNKPPDMPPGGQG